MRKLILTALMAGCIFVSTLSLSRTARAQETTKDQHSSESPKPAKAISVYRLEFVVRELDEGKRLNTRTYTMLLGTTEMGKISVGNRVPYLSSKDQYQFQDVGMHIQCTLVEAENLVQLNNLAVDISSVVKDELGGAPNPVFRRADFQISTAVTPGKPTIVTTLDDVSSNRRYEVEVTATKVK